MKRIFIYLIQVIAAIIAIIGFAVFVDNGKIVIENIRVFGGVLITCGLTLTGIIILFFKENTIKIKNREVVLWICTIGILILTISKLITVFRIGEVNKDSLWAIVGVLLGTSLVVYLFKDILKLRKEKEENKN